MSFNIINTNVRSLQPKVSSLITAVEELDVDLAIITETWFSKGDNLRTECERLLLGHGLETITRNRELNNTCLAHGGVAIILKSSATRPKTIDFPNPESYEVLAVSTPLVGIKRKLFIIAAYVPPGYNVARGRGCLQHIADLKLHIKDNDNAPLICVAGDFNQWEIDTYREEFPELVEVISGPTRNNRRIDRTFINWQIDDHNCLAPLQTEADRDGSIQYSDHLIQLTNSSIQRRPCQE